MRLTEDAIVTACANPLAAGIRPEPYVLVSEWAAEHRVLVQASSAETGTWRNERTPYLVEIMDCLTPFSGVEQVSVMKGAQGGFTEAGNNWTGYVIHKTPGPMLYVQPTVDAVKKYSRMRLAPMIEACKPLRERIRESRSRDSANTVFMKEFPGGVLTLAGSNSASALRSMPIRFLFLDECDAYPLDVDNEGDPIELAEKRTTTFRNRKIFKISTPTLAGMSHIETSYKQGDMRQWTVPCPLCQRTQVLRWRFEDDEMPGGLRWKRGSFDTAMYQCCHCLKLIPEFRKTWMNENGVWVPSRLDGDPKIRSYQWPSLYSPYGWPGSSWPELAKKWEQGSKDPTKLKVFFNAELGLPYEDKAARAAEPHVLMERCEHYLTVAPDGALIIPNDIALITLGADVQMNRIEWELVGWSKGEESYSLATGIVSGDTTTLVPFNELDRALLQAFRNVAGVELKVMAGCIDANFNTQTVTTWCGPRFNRRVYAIRGVSGKNRVIWPRLPGVNKYNKTPLYTLGVDSAKEAVVGRLAIELPGPGYSHFPVGREEDYFTQLTAEVCVTVYDKIPPYNVWRLKNGQKRNEALDCRVYAYAALCGLIAGGFNLDAETVKMGLLVAARLASLTAVPRLGASNPGRTPRFQMGR